MTETTPAATGTGDLAAVLDPIRERAEIIKRAARARTPGAPYALNLARRHSAQDVPRLLAVADAVLKVHRMSDLGGEHCINCCFAWPCPTIQAVSAALRGTEADRD